jgi:hypothetical protein
MHGVLSAAADVMWLASSGILRLSCWEQWDVQFMLSRSAVLNLWQFELALTELY